MGKIITDSRNNPDTAEITTELKMNGYNRVEVSEITHRIAHEISYDVVFYFTKQNTGKAPSKHASTMRRTVEDMTEKHAILYKGMLSKLHITEDNFGTIFLNVANEVFRDGQYNWGRVASVFAFGAQIAVRLNLKLLKKLAIVMGEYASTKLGVWIDSNGGWDAFDEHFPEQRNFEESLWKGLAFTLVGLGAIATVVVAVR